MSKVQVLFEDCDPELAKDKKLPYSAFLIEYRDEEGHKKYDISSAYKQVDLFDHYWDKYKTGFIGGKQTEGNVNPKMYGYKSPASKSKK